MKKSRTKLLWISLFVAIALVLFYYLGLFGDIFKLGSPQHCSLTPRDFNCVCGSNEVKQGMFPWECNTLPETPSEITFPIETWEEARGYAESLLGGFECTGAYQYDNILSGEITKQCNQYGSTMTTSENGNSKIYMGHILIIECRSIDTVDNEGKPVSGQIVFSVRFDPNDGWVYELSCKDNLISCPEITFRDNYKTDPQTTCGDTCCHYGETYENCPSDCPYIEPPQCSGEDIANWINTNGGQSAYEKLCTIANGIVQKTGFSDYIDCDYGQYNCQINGIEIFRWHENSGGSCGVHSLLRYNQSEVCPQLTKHPTTTMYESPNLMTCLDTIYGVKSSNLDSIPDGSMYWIGTEFPWLGENKCLSSASIAYPGGCPAFPTPDLNTASCTQLKRGLICGKTTPTEFKNALVMRSLNCLPSSLLNFTTTWN